jgi:hypothetical protein
MIYYLIWYTPLQIIMVWSFLYGLFKVSSKSPDDVLKGGVWISLSLAMMLVLVKTHTGVVN